MDFPGHFVKCVCVTLLFSLCIAKYKVCHTQPPWFHFRSATQHMPDVCLTFVCHICVTRKRKGITWKGKNGPVSDFNRLCERFNNPLPIPSIKAFFSFFLNFSLTVINVLLFLNHGWTLFPWVLLGKY